MKGIFHPDRNYYWEEEPWPSPSEIRNLDPKEDRCYLEHIVQYARGARQKMIMKKLGITELPEKTVNPEDPSDRDYGEYFILEEQVCREPDAEVLKEAAYRAPTQMAKFAFCRLTGYFYPSPWNDAYSYHNYECSWKEGMTTEDVIEFCREMIAVQGPFAWEAVEILADPPKDHNDHYGNRMVSHEREMSEPPYVRKERLAPFRESEEYEQGRAEVLQLEVKGHEVLAAGDKEKAIYTFMEMGRKSEQLGKYTQRWDSIDDYARCCIALAEICDTAFSAEEAAEILRRLIREGPEEKVYREQLKQAEAVFRKAAKETALKTGFIDAEDPIVFYHSFEPMYAEVFCRLLEDRFRVGGGKRQIEFIWQETAPPEWEDFAEALRRPRIRRQESEYPACEISDDTESMIGDICCCDLPTMIKLYDTSGNLTGISPFIDTDNIFPGLLEQCRIKWDVCGIPVLMIEGAVQDAADSGEEEQAAGLRPFFALMNHSYGFRRLDCLDLMMLMSDSDFLFDVCRACNEGDEVPHVFPANRKACARLAEEVPGYAAAFDKLQACVQIDTKV